jgi:hypothetical protein
MGSLGYDRAKVKLSDTNLEPNGEFSTGDSENTADSFAAPFGFNQLYLGGAYYFCR